MARAGAMAAAGEEMRGMARPANVSPTQAMGAVMRLAAGQLAYASARVATLADEQLFVQGYSLDEGAIKMVPHHWLKLQRDIMGDVARYAKMAADAGIAERGVVLQERQTQIVAEMLQRIVSALDLTDAQREALGPTIRKELTVIDEAPT